MSRGLGQIERAIIEVSHADQGNAFTVAELCDRIYGVPPLKKHRVAMLRAMRSVESKSVDFGLIAKHGVGAVLFRWSLASCEMAYSKLEGQRLLRRKWWSNGDARFWNYRGKEHYSRGTFFYHRLTVEELETVLRSGFEAQARNK